MTTPKTLTVEEIEPRFYTKHESNGSPCCWTISDRMLGFEVDGLISQVASNWCRMLDDADESRVGRGGAPWYELISPDSPYHTDASRKAIRVYDPETEWVPVDSGQVPEVGRRVVYLRHDGRRDGLVWCDGASFASPNDTHWRYDFAPPESGE